MGLPTILVMARVPLLERRSKTEKGVNYAVRLTGCNTFYDFQLTDKRLKNYLILRPEQVYPEQKADEEREDIEKRVGYEKRGQESQNKGGN